MPSTWNFLNKYLQNGWINCHHNWGIKYFFKVLALKYREFLWWIAYCFLYNIIASTAWRLTWSVITLYPFRVISHFNNACFLPWGSKRPDSSQKEWLNLHQTSEKFYLFIQVLITASLLCLLLPPFTHSLCRKGSNYQISQWQGLHILPNELFSKARALNPNAY